MGLKGCAKPGPKHWLFYSPLPSQVFKLTRSNVDDDRTRLLVRSLLDHPSLVELDLSHNLIGDKGAQAVSKLLNHSKLEILHLCNNQIRDEGAQALAQALAKNCTLTSLNLRLNHVEDKGGEAMGCALLTNTTLKSLHLGGNRLAEPTAVLFSQVLTQNSTLTCINFSCNPIGPVRETPPPCILASCMDACFDVWTWSSSWGPCLSRGLDQVTCRGPC